MCRKGGEDESADRIVPIVFVSKQGGRGETRHNRSGGVECLSPAVSLTNDWRGTHTHTGPNGRVWGHRLASSDSTAARARCSE
jgi:hypothetical protein